MARRKPTRVEWNRQQRERREPPASSSSDAPSDPASNELPHVIVIEDSDENSTDEDAAVAPPSKQPRTLEFMRQRCGYIDSITQKVVELRVGVPSVWAAGRDPWDEAKRAEALWVTFPVDPAGYAADKLSKLDAGGAFAGSNAGGATVGICVLDRSEREEAMDDPSRTTAIVRKLIGGLGRFFDNLVVEGIVTMEIQRTVQESSGRPEYEWRVGVDWRRGHPNVFDVMLWILHESGQHQESAKRQWTYAYPTEIDALYFRHLGPWESRSETTAFDVHDVYAKIDVQRQLQRDTSNIPDHITATGSALLPNLRDYQKAALSWMLEREGVRSTNQDQDMQDPASDVRWLSRCVRFHHTEEATQGASEGSTLYYDLFLGSFTLRADTAMPNLHEVRGGILADEMGLGKTVEVITLVLSNPSSLTRPILETETSISEIAQSKSSFEKNCICGSEDDCNPGWVQCDLCNFWHHQLCTGFDPDGLSPYAFGENSELGENTFICFHCQIEQHLVLSCKTTLIVSPESIHHQWESELKRHVKPGALKLLRYPGVKALRTRLQGKGPTAEWRILASLGADMAKYDIVLTTYEALGSDVHHVPTSIGKSRRASTRQKRKRYAFVGSPLVFLKFWRVCMDEAQVGVENTQLQAALTVAEIRSEKQWIVTGTPFSTQLMDLYGCFKFLRVKPYSVFKEAFQDQIVSVYTRGAVERLFDLLLWDGRTSRSGGGLLWRTNKKDVLSQLGLPSQSQEIVWCRFSNVERLFYDKQEVEVVRALKKEEGERRRRLGESFDENEEVGETVWHRLLLLRQVCCHPQVGQILRSIGASTRFDRRRNGRGNGVGPQSNSGRATMAVLTMDDFLLQLFEKCRRECEEAQRKLISAHNGHASLALISDDYSTAITKYMLSVQLIRSNWNDFRADLLPRLHILDNLANSVRRAFNIEAATQQAVAGTNQEDVVMVDDDQESSVAGGDNPKHVSLMPDLPVLLCALTSKGLVTEGIDADAIAKECEALEKSAAKIRQFYLLEGEAKHSSALHHFESVHNTTETKLYRPQPRRGRSRDDEYVNDPMLCSSSGWWLEMFDVLIDLPGGQVHVVHMVDRLRAHLYALGTTWAVSFVERFHDVRGLMLALVYELTTLNKKWQKMFKKLLDQSKQTPTKTDIEISGNCKQCRDARDGPICWHCKFYKELEGYRQHLLGIDNTVAPMTGLASWTAELVIDGDEENQDEGDDSMTTTDSTTASTSLILDIFRQLSSGARLLLRENRNALNPTLFQQLTKLFQDGAQQEAEVWTQLLREWDRAKKLFQAQHQRLGALDELEMAQMKIRLRLPGEVVETATDKLYKLQPHELPVKLLALDGDRVVAETELKQKQSELRYLKHLKSETDNALTTATAIDDKTCVVCLEEFGLQRVAMLPCAHRTCLKCSEKLAARMRSSRSIRCPTCRRIFPIDDRKEVENDPTRAKELSLAARIARTRVATPDNNVTLLQSGFSSKIDAILRRVRALATKNPELKALVFTQWQDMMGVIAAALQLNGIKCFTYTTKKQFHRVLQEFKLFPTACALALPFKIGANGLNIIEATEVLLVEPLLNTSIEAQAINRVHRIGQTKQTRVHRFVVDNSVEERIHWLGRKKRSRASTNEEAKEEDEEDGGANMDEDESVVIGRQEKEKITLSQLQSLLYGRMMVVDDHDDQELDGGVTVSSGEHPFWQQRVEMSGRAMSRREARELLERRRAAERRATEASEDEPVTLLVDRDVGLPVAYELLQLQVSSEDADAPPEAMRELVGMAQHRIGEEMRVWRASMAANVG